MVAKKTKTMGMPKLPKINVDVNMLKKPNNFISLLSILGVLYLIMQSYSQKMKTIQLVAFVASYMFFNYKMKYPIHRALVAGFLVVFAIYLFSNYVYNLEGFEDDSKQNKENKGKGDEEDDEEEDEENDDEEEGMDGMDGMHGMDEDPEAANSRFAKIAEERKERNNKAVKEIQANHDKMNDDEDDSDADGEGGDVSRHTPSSSAKPKLDNVGTASESMTNLAENLTPKGMEAMTKDAKELMSRQEKLAESMKDMQPMMDRAASMLQQILPSNKTAGKRRGKEDESQE